MDQFCIFVVVSSKVRQAARPHFSPDQPTTVGAYLPHFAKAMWGRPESTELRSDKGLDLLSSTPARFVPSNVVQ